MWSVFAARGERCQRSGRFPCGHEVERRDIAEPPENSLQKSAAGCRVSIVFPGNVWWLKLPYLSGSQSDGQGVDHRTGATCLFPKEGQRDWQAEAAGAGGAGVQPEGAAGFLDARLVGVPRDHDIPALGLRISLQSLAIMDHVYLHASDRQAHRFGKDLSPVPAINVAPDCRHRGDARQRVKMVGVADVASVQDPVYTFESLQRLGAQQTVGISDDTDAFTRSC